MNKFRKNLQGDIIKIEGKKIFINPFLYFRRLDQNTKIWFREFSQISESEIFANRVRFYPELDLINLSKDEQFIINSTVEIFLKTLKIIKTFHPTLTFKQLETVERNLVFFKKVHFEKYAKKHLREKSKLLLKEKKKLERADFIFNWQKWFSLKETQQLLIPVFVIILLSALIGWFTGVSKNSCNPYFESSVINQ
tara:strand:+ start:227 stop:811 length:585 start_codon:yes stop_codon:yes gene_type:complete